jgi:hypothetical protein
MLSASEGIRDSLKGRSPLSHYQHRIIEQELLTYKQIFD